MVSSFRKNECSNVPMDTLMTHKVSSFLMNERPSLHQALLQTWPSSGGVPRALGGDDLLNRFLARGFRGNLAEIRRMGPGAWHPLTPSWVPSTSLERVV